MRTVMVLTKSSAIITIMCGFEFEDNPYEKNNVQNINLKHHIINTNPPS